MLENVYEKEKTCRTCTKSGSDHSSLFAKHEALDGICYSDMITEFTMYSIHENDDLPHLICSECKEKVRVAYDFKKQCEESHRKLLSLIQPTKSSPIGVDEVCAIASDREDKVQDSPEVNVSVRKKSTRRASSKRHPCQKCDQTFADVDLLEAHVRKEHKGRRHNCPKCPKNFIRLGHLTRHMNMVHKGEEILHEIITASPVMKAEDVPTVRSETSVKSPVKAESDSEGLDYDFGTDNDDDPSYPGDNQSIKPVKGEAEAADNKPSTDEVPTKKEEQPEDTEENTIPTTHENAESPPEFTKPSNRGLIDSNRKFQCDQCHKAFKRKSHLKQHSLCHTKIKPYPCTICQKRFGRPDNLKVHMSNHGQKQFQCNACDRSFGQAYLLKRHKDQTHSEEKPFLCSECGQRFVRNGDLAVHMRRHTGEKPYKCQYCNKGFTRSTEVYVHERYHTGEKRHVCSICGKAFQRPYNLLVHVRTHTGERPYQCPHCPKNFAQCSDLKAHIRRHTGERYRCDQCGMGFIHVFVLNQHKLSVHGIEVPSRIKRVAKLSTDTQ